MQSYLLIGFLYQNKSVKLIMDVANNRVPQYATRNSEKRSYIQQIKNLQYRCTILLNLSHITFPAFIVKNGVSFLMRNSLYS